MLHLSFHQTCDWNSHMRCDMSLRTLTIRCTCLHWQTTVWLSIFCGSCPSPWRCGCLCMCLEVGGLHRACGRLGWVGTSLRVLFFSFLDFSFFSFFFSFFFLLFFFFSSFSPPSICTTIYPSTRAVCTRKRNQKKNTITIVT